MSNISFASINDSGQVAFLGTVNGYSNVIEGTVSDGPSTLTDLTASLAANTFTFPQIDNAGDVIAQTQDLIGGGESLETFIQLWHPNGQDTGKATGNSLSGNVDLIPIISPDGKQYAYQDNMSGVLGLMINGALAHVFPSGSGACAQ